MSKRLPARYPYAVELRFRSEQERRHFLGQLSDGWGENLVDLEWTDESLEVSGNVGPIGVRLGPDELELTSSEHARLLELLLLEGGHVQQDGSVQVVVSDVPCAACVEKEREAKEKRAHLVRESTILRESLRQLRATHERAELDHQHELARVIRENGAERDALVSALEAERGVHGPGKVWRAPG